MRNKIIITVFALIIVASFIGNKGDYSSFEMRSLMERPTFEGNIESYLEEKEAYNKDRNILRTPSLIITGVANHVFSRNSAKNVYITSAGLIPFEFEADRNIYSANCDAVNKLMTNAHSGYFVLIPSSTLIYENSLPPFTKKNHERQAISNCYVKMNNSLTIDLYPSFVDKSKNAGIYYKTDTHMTTYGAFLTYNSIRMSKGLEKYQLSEMTVSRLVDGYRGNLSKITGDILTGNDEILLYEKGSVKSVTVDGKEKSGIYYEEFLDTQSPLGFFLGENNKFTDIHTNSTNTKSILIYTDSFASPLIPMMLDDYDRITVINVTADNDFEYSVNPKDYDEVMVTVSSKLFLTENITDRLK